MLGSIASRSFEPPRVLKGEDLCGLTFFQFITVVAKNLILQQAKIIVCVLTGRLVSCTLVDTSSTFSSYSGSGLSRPREFCISKGLWYSFRRLRETLGDAPIGSDRYTTFTILKSMEKVQLSRHLPQCKILILLNEEV